MQPMDANGLRHLAVAAVVTNRPHGRTSQPRSPGADNRSDLDASLNPLVKAC